jgi:formate C-acetyltransferase
MGCKVMGLWTEETWKYRTQSTGRQFRPMLSWNAVADSFVLPAGADGRPVESLSVPVRFNGAVNDPTANVNSVGKVLGGRRSMAGRLGRILEFAAQRRQLR